MALLKIGSEKRHKIGWSNWVDRRQSELSIQLPEKLELVHYMKTDDPLDGKYWHDRFRDKNTNGEWFKLTAEDIRDFKKRRVM
jgi:hypothetical protein